MSQNRCPACGGDIDPETLLCKGCRQNRGTMEAATPSPDTETIQATPPPAQLPYVPPTAGRRGFSGWSLHKKASLIFVILIVLAVVAFIGYKVIRHYNHQVLVLGETPSGYERMSGEELKDAEERFEASEEGGSLDAVYLSGGRRSIFIAHYVSNEVQILAFGSGGDPPETHDIEEMRRFIYENRDELERELEATYREVSPGMETTVIEPVQLASDGFCGIHIGARATMGEDEYVQDRLLFYKDGNTYLAAAQNFSGESNDIEVEYLLQNLHFE